MFASDIIKILTEWNFEKSHTISDPADVFSSVWTYALTMTFCAVMAMKTYVLSPIECHVPVTFGGSNFDDYVNNYCFVEGSVAIPKNHYGQHFPQSEKQWDISRKKGGVGYYPWIPLFLGVSALVPFLINTLWSRFTSRRVGADLQLLMEKAASAALETGEQRRNSVEQVAGCLHDMLLSHRDFREGRVASLRRRIAAKLHFGFASKRMGSWLHFTYLVSKLLYLASHVANLVAMHHFLGLGPDYRLFGFKVFANIVRGDFWEDTLVFPRVTWCQVPIKHNRVNWATAQCVLPGNLFSEIVFALFWLWHAALACVMAVSLCQWAARAALRGGQKGFVKKCLKLSTDLPPEETRDTAAVRRFVGNYLQQDGVFVVRMFASGAGGVVTIDIVAELWRRFREMEKLEKPLPRPYDWVRDRLGARNCVVALGDGEPVSRSREEAEE